MSNQMDRSLSVIFTVYNKEAYLKKAVDCLYDALSILTTPYEVIIIEDQSTDSSYDIIKPYGERPHTTLLRNETNKGHFQTKCRGYLTAKNTWIMTIDGDDYVDREYIKELIDAVEEDTYLLLARNNKVLTTEISDSTIYWSIHNLPFMIFRRELIINHADYYSAEIPKSAWDDCIIVTPLYCQVTEMMMNGNHNALKHYKNVNRYRVNYTHSNEEIKGVAVCTLTKGVELMKHLSDWTIRTGYFDKFSTFILSVLTQYLGVFRPFPKHIQPFVNTIHPKKDDSCIVIYEYTDSSKEFKDYKQVFSQHVLFKDIYFAHSFTDAIKALIVNGLYTNKPIIRLSGDGNITPICYKEIIDKLKELNDSSFDIAGYVYKHKGKQYIDYSRPVIYNTSFVKNIASLPYAIMLQEAVRLRGNYKIIPLNDLLDKISYTRSNINYSLTYIPKVINKLNRPPSHLLSAAIKGTNMKDIPIFYIKDSAHSEEEHKACVERFAGSLKREIKAVTFEALIENVKEIEDKDSYAFILTSSMQNTICNRLPGVMWQMRFDGKSFDVITNVPCLIKDPNRLRLYNRLNDPVNVKEYGGIVRISLINETLDAVSGEVYQSI
jgi:glycosyltransferase involved in cell wall biosynthesis